MIESKTVLVHGVFDILHAGHISYFEAAKAHGHRLVVSVTSDRFVNKGPGRPCFPVGVRANLLRALKVVDEVVVSDCPTAVEVIERVRPDFYIKGPDYKGVDTKDLRDEIDAVKAVGGEFLCIEAPAYSSSALANQFFVAWSDEQKEMIAKVKQLGGMEAIENVLKGVEDTVRTLVVGECIRDVYRFVRPEGLSSKSPTVSARFLREEAYEGGAWAITRHMESFCPVKQHRSVFEHRKIRYISEDTGQRLFEVTEIANEAKMSTRGLPEHNLLLVADFGHGLIPSSLITRAFKALNVQTNSSNYGFNSFKRHSTFDYLVADVRELRLAYQDRVTNAIDLGLWAHTEFDRPIAVTLGPEGSAFYKNGQLYKCPAFCDRVVDAIGAGDAFFAITSLLVKVGADPVLIGFLGNVFAGLKAKIIGNKAAVSKDALIRTCAAILR